MRCVCHRCGRVLSSEQALNYHLSKKIKCNSLFCKTCNVYFTSKTKFKNHSCTAEKKKNHFEFNCNVKIKERKFPSWP